jgi:glycosyltransferase involved in cell wall biosynthesis
MDKSKFVTIVIPTFNRAEMLKASISSALAQHHQEIEVLVMDNASTDNTREIVESFTDERLIYHRNDTNIGMIRNFNLALELNKNPFVVILQDDDLLLPGYAGEMVSRLLKNPNAGFAYTMYRNVDAAGNPGRMQDLKGIPADTGIEDGKEYLHLLVSQQGLTIHSSTILYRASALLQTGYFDSPHSKHLNDFNLLVRLASKFDVAFVAKELAYIRTHAGQETEIEWRSSAGTGRLGYNAERIDALAVLLGSERAADPAYRSWLMHRLMKLNAEHSYFAYNLLPSMYWSWEERLETAEKEIGSVIPLSESFLLIDDDQWGTGGNFAGRKAVPFPGKDGVYWGSPADDASAIEQLRADRRSGMRYVVIAWPAFWWTDYYQQLMEELEHTADKVYSSSRIIIFKLHTLPAEDKKAIERLPEERSFAK